MGYQIILADCPWVYQDKALAGNRGAGCKYPLMTTEALCALPVQKLTAKDCALFFWVTMPKLEEGFRVIESWGFKYKTCAFTWIKTNPKSGTPFWGMGRFTRANPELCLLATRGSPKRISASVHSVVMSPIREHSRKPDEVKERILQLLGDLPRLEMFAREKTHGFDVWGNELPNDTSLLP